MGAARWIVGFLGWVTFGPIGALLGYLAGSYIEDKIDFARQIGDGSSASSRQRQTTGQYQRGNTSRRYTQTEQRNSFYVSLLVLSSAVIKADGKVDSRELNYVVDFFRKNFGDAAAQEARQMLEKLNGQQVNIYQVGGQIAANMNYSQRLQLLQYLVQIAMADGNFDAAEKSVIEAIAAVIQITTSDAASVIAMYYKENDAAYTILEITPSATDDEVKAAYRRMAMKYHPDRVSTLGPDVQKAAEEKFKKVQEAYETIKKLRGMN
jgi:DnaJ like chaperone protein